MIGQFIELNNIDIIYLNETKRKYETIVSLLLGFKEKYHLIINAYMSANMHGVFILIKKEFQYEHLKLNISYAGRSETRSNDPTYGRIIRNIVIVCVYIPNSGVNIKQPLKNLDYRISQWDKCLLIN